LNKQNPILRTSSVILLIICAAVICYANSFSVPFLWDDEVLILRNHYIRSWNFLEKIFSSTHFQGGGEGGNFYRPLQIISYLFDYSLWQLRPFGYHLTNLILHCLVAIFAYLIVVKISTSSLAGLLTGLFFVVHPIHTEAVTYIAGRADLLASVFLLSAFLCFLNTQSATSNRKYFLGGACCLFYICALLSKESALIFLPLILLYGVCFLHKKEIKLWIPWYVCLVLISALYILLRGAILPFGISRSLSLITQAPLAIRGMTIPRIYLTYLGLLSFPVYLHMERHFLTTSLLSVYFWLGSILWLITIYFLRVSYRRNRIVFFFLGWFIITLIPILNIISLNATAAEHWLYLPSLGFWAAISILVVKLLKHAVRYRKKIFVILGCIIFIFYCVRSVIRNFQWQSSIRLYAHDLKYSPHSFLLYNNLGVELFRAWQMDAAAEAFESAVKIRPNYATSRNNLGVILENKGMRNEALREYQVAIKLNNYILAYGNLGRLYLELDKLGEAQEVSEQAQKLYPLNAEINYNLAVTYFRQGDFIRAKEKFEQVSVLAPHYRDIDIYLKKF